MLRKVAPIRSAFRRSEQADIASHVRHDGGRAADAATAGQPMFQGRTNGIRLSSVITDVIRRYGGLHSPLNWINLSAQGIVVNLHQGTPSMSRAAQPEGAEPTANPRPVRLMVTGFVLTVLITVGAAVISIQRIEGGLSEVSDQQADAYVVLLGMDGIVNDAVQELFAYLVSGEVAELEDYRVMADTLNEESIRFASLSRLAESGRERELAMLGDIQKDWTRSFGEADAMLRDYDNDGKVSSESFAVFEATVDSVTTNLNILLEIEQARDAAARAARDQIIRESELLLGITAIASAIAMAIIGTFLTRNVARHIAAVEETKEELSLLDVAMNSTNVGFCFASASEDQPLIYVNDAMVDISGYEKTELIGENCRLLQGPETNPEDVSRIRNAIAKGEQIGLTIRNHRKNGEPFWNELLIAPVRDQAGKLTHFVGVSHDVTGRVEAESQLLRAQKLDAVGQLAGGIAHDFNNYLTVICANAELIEKTGSDPQAAGLAKQILDAGERSAELTRHLLAFSRRQILVPEVLDLNRVILDMDPLLRRTLGENISLETVTAGGLGMVTADRARIEQVLLNLVVNARDAQPDGGRITIETGNVFLDTEYADHNLGATSGRFVMIAVSDEGTGIPSDVLDRIYDPFYTTKAHGSSGLGLSTALGIVQQSGGLIRVYTEEGSGTTFKVYLPQVRGEAQAKPTPPVDTMTDFSGRILVVDDQPMVLGVTVQMLEQLGFNVDSVCNAEDALDLLDKVGEQIQLLLTDVMLPGMSGRELAEIAQAKFPSLKVLYMSGYTENGIIHHGRLDDGIDFLPKPFTSNDLRRKISEVLSPG